MFKLDAIGKPRDISAGKTWQSQLLSTSKETPPYKKGGQTLYKSKILIVSLKYRIIAAKFFFAKKLEMHV